MPKPRTPTVVLEAKGAFKKNPNRKASRSKEPKSNGPVGLPPAYFDAEHRAIWDEFIAEAPTNVLTKADRKILELATRLTRKQRFMPGGMKRWMRFLGDALQELGMNGDAVEQMQDDMRSIMGCSVQEASLLRQCLNSLGMTPADRSKVHSAPEEEGSSEWDAFGPVQ